MVTQCPLIYISMVNDVKQYFTCLYPIQIIYFVTPIFFSFVFLWDNLSCIFSMAVSISLLAILSPTTSKSSKVAGLTQSFTGRNDTGRLALLFHIINWDTFKSQKEDSHHHY